MTSYIPYAHDRLIMVARLNGYLDALSSIDGWFRDHFMYCTLVDKKGLDVRSAVFNSICETLKEATVDFQYLEEGLTHFLKEELLKKPFGYPAKQFEIAFPYTKNELINQISEMISLMADDFHPLEKWLIEIDIKSEDSYCGVAVEFKTDILIILSQRGDKGYKTCVDNIIAKRK